MTNPDSHELLERFQAGDSRAAAAIFDRYVERLLALARDRIGAKLRRRIDPEDVVQSAYKSFFVRAEKDKFVLERSGDLWRLLAGITLNKLRGQVERQTAARRSINREETPDSIVLNAAARTEPTPVEVVAIIEQLQLICKRLKSAEQTVLTARLQGQTIEEICAAIKKSPRTVRRLLAQAHDQLERELMQSAAHTSATGPQFTHLPDPRAPLLYEDFTLERLLGAGGMGKVYRATQRSTGTTIAFKSLLKSRQGDRLVIEKFLQEAQILATLNHPGIVGVHGVGRFPGGGYFIAMDFVDGVDLQVLIANGPLQIAEAARVVGAVAEAMDYAHDQGIVHGDLKPANILVDKNNHVVVTDFGLAQFVVNDANPNPSRLLVGGTAGYMAPEVCARNSTPTPAADVYAMGALLWALVKGRTPDQIELTGTHNDSISPIVAICARCLNKNPRQRYQCARDVATQLKHLSRNVESA